MKFKSVQKKIERVPEDLARIRAIREKFQSERPTVAQLLESGDYTEPVSHGAYLETKQLLHELKKHREEAGLSLADVANRTGMDRAAISRLENGHQPNPTVETISRYAMAVGKQIAWSLVDLPSTKSLREQRKAGKSGASKLAGKLSEGDQES